MYIIGTNDLGVSFGEKTLFQGVTFSVNQGEHVALVGVNGAGKSTLMRLLYDPSFLPHTGSVFLSRGKTVGYMEQLPALSDKMTVFGTALSVFSELLEEERMLEEMTDQMRSSSDEKLIARFTDLQNRFIASGGYEFRSRAKGTLVGMGFPAEMLERSVSTLSGGQKTILQLSLLLLREPDVLLLDEPTNHLDIRSLEWLEDRLSRIHSTVIVISHDRYFLDRVTEKTLDLENGEAKLYPAPYARFREMKKKEREIQARHYINQQKEIARMEAFIEQQRRWNRERNIIAAESRQKAIDRMVKVQDAAPTPESIRFQFQKTLESGQDVLSVRDLSMGFGDNGPLFSNLSFEVKKGDRLLITGANGAGKSTLLQILTGHMTPNGGTYRYGYNVRLGYYDQYQHLNGSKTVLEEVWDESDLDHTAVRKLLATFLFRGDDVYKPVSVLSGGERARLVLAKLMQKKVNLLLLDEPTNHLDVESREALEDALTQFEGTIIAVSHDRYFIKKLSTRILDFQGEKMPPDKRVFLFNGGYDAYLSYKAEENNRAFPEEQMPADPKKPEKAQNERYRAGKEERRRAARIRTLESEIEKNEEALKQIEEQFVEKASDYLALEELCRRQEELKKESDALWEELTRLSEE